MFQQNNKTTTQTGFTLIEMITVLALVVLLIALLLPALQAAREASRKAVCIQNLKQIGLGLANYESIHRVFPQGVNGSSYSAHCMILPFLESNNLYNNINFLTSSDDSSNYTSRQVGLSVFSCPSDVLQSNNSDVSYAANGGYGLQVIDFVGTFCDGFTLNKFYIGPQGIPDGLSQTLAMCEWKRKDQFGIQSNNSIYNVKKKFSDNDYNIFVYLCSSAGSDSILTPVTLVNTYWIEGQFGSTILNFNLNINKNSCQYNGNFNAGVWSPGSYHRGGVNAVFHDGHTQLVSDNIDINALRSLSSKSGGDNN